MITIFILNPNILDSIKENNIIYNVVYISKVLHLISRIIYKSLHFAILVTFKFIMFVLKSAVSGLPKGRALTLRRRRAYRK